MLGGAVAVGILLFLLIADKPWTVELPADKPLKIHHFVAIYEWWAAAINLVFVALLGATAQMVLAARDCRDGTDHILGNSTPAAKPLG